MKDFLKGLKKGIHNFGENIATLINTVLLFVVYVLGVGITAILAKLSGKHFLQTKIDKDKKTYWSDLNLGKKSIEDYYRQF